MPGKDFDTDMRGNGELNAMTPKKQSKPTVEASLFNMADDKNYF